MVTPYQARLIELLDRLEQVLGELREHVQEAREPSSARAQEVRAFVDEAFRDRDA